MADFTRVVLTVTCRQGGVNQTGRVSVTASNPLRNGVDLIEVAKPIVVALVAGVATFTQLACTDDSFTLPVGATYLVTKWVDGEQPVTGYYALPKTLAPGPVDLASLVSVSPTAPYVPPVPPPVYTPSFAAGGDLAGLYPNPTVSKINGVTVNNAPTVGQVLTGIDATHASFQTGTSVQKAGNLSDLANIPDARTNLGLSVGPTAPTPAVGFGEYLWFATDGAGTLLDIQTGVA